MEDVASLWHLHVILPAVGYPSTAALEILRIIVRCGPWVEPLLYSPSSGGRGWGACVMLLALPCRAPLAWCLSFVAGVVLPRGDPRGILAREAVATPFLPESRPLARGFSVLLFALRLRQGFQKVVSSSFMPLDYKSGVVVAQSDFPALSTHARLSSRACSVRPRRCCRCGCSRRAMPLVLRVA